MKLHFVFSSMKAEPERALHLRERVSKTGGIENSLANVAGDAKTYVGSGAFRLIACPSGIAVPETIARVAQERAAPQNSALASWRPDRVLGFRNAGAPFCDVKPKPSAEDAAALARLKT